MRKPKGEKKARESGADQTSSNGEGKPPEPTSAGWLADHLQSMQEEQDEWEDSEEGQAQLQILRNVAKSLSKDGGDGDTAPGHSSPTKP